MTSTDTIALTPRPRSARTIPDGSP
jgi:hypothetical protein